MQPPGSIKSDKAGVPGTKALRWKASASLPWRSLGLSALVSVLLLALVLSGKQIGPEVLGARLGWPLLRLTAIIGIGLAAGVAIEATGWSRLLGLLAAPLFRFANLGPLCATSFATAFVSGVAANAMLWSFYQEGRIGRGQLYLSNLVNQFPSFFLHLPTTFFMIVPLTGKAGLIYFALTLAAALVRTGLMVAWGRLALQGRPAETAAHGPGQTGVNAAAVWQKVKTRLPRRLYSVITYVVPTYILVFWLNAAGFFTTVRDWLTHLALASLLPVEAFSVVVLSFMAESASGYAAAGALLHQGLLTTKQTVLALLIGNLIAMPIRALRHQLPHYIGIFTPATGAALLLAGQGLRIASLVFIGAAYWAWA